MKHYTTDDLLKCIADLLPLAEGYLKSAPSHPDNAKLEEARAILEWDRWGGRESKA